MLQPQFNKYPKPTDLNSLYFLVQQAFESGFRGTTFKELVNYIVDYLPERLAQFQIFDVAPADSPVATDDVSRTYQPTDSGTYTNFLDINEDPLVVDLSAGFVTITGNTTNGFKTVVTPIDLSGYATTAQVNPVIDVVNGGSSTFGVTDALNTYTTAYSGSGSMRINAMALSSDSVVKKITFQCRRAGTVSIRFLRFTESNQVYAYNVLTFTAVLGVNEFVSGVGFDEFTMLAGDMYSTYASNNLGSVGFKEKTNASYSLTGSLAGTPVDWTLAVPSDTEWGIILDIELIGLIEQVPALNASVFSESNPILKQSSLGIDGGVIESINGTPIKASESVFDQSLNTFDNVEFANVKVNGMELDLPTGTVEPGGLGIGDAWIDTANGNVIKVKLS